MQKENPKRNSFKSIVEIGLLYWIKSQCNSIGELKIEIKDLILGVLNYKISSIKLHAKNINFRNILIEKLELETGTIELGLNILKNNQNIISINNQFNIEASLTLNENQINEMLSSKQWNWLGEWIAEKFFKLKLLHEILIDNNFLTAKVFNRDKNKLIEKKIILYYISR